jgi:hypothetical protein
MLIKPACIAVALLAGTVLVAAAQTSSSQPAVLYGRLLFSIDHRPAAGHAVKLRCPTVDASVSEAITDGRGSYTMLVLASQRGSCRLWVEHQGRRSEPVEVFVGASSLRYDLLLDAKFGISKS